VSGESPSALPEDLVEAATEAGWSSDVLARAVALRMPISSLRRFLGWGLAEAHMVKKVEWFERLTYGELRGREATGDDNESFGELWENSPESIGDFEVTAERAPNAFAQYRLQDRVNLLVIADGPRLVASCGFATRNVLVAGRKMCVRYGQGLRVHRDYRRRGFGDQVRSISWGIGCARESAVQYDIMRTANFAVVGWWEKYFPDFFKGVPTQEGQVPGIPVVVLQVPAPQGTADTPGIRPTRRADLARCAALVNRTQRGQDLFRPYTRESLGDRLDENVWGDPPPWHQAVYRWGDHFIVEDGGRIMACGGLWDRGRDMREVWRHEESGQTRRVSDAALMDWGYEEGGEDAMLRLVRTLAARAGELGRDYLLAPFQQDPILSAALVGEGAVPETRALRWGLDEPKVTRPYTDLAYW
jgi:ribosomal protein S18 acetylase RimI-like enzyme